MKGKVLCVTFIVFAAALTGFARAQDDVPNPYAYVSALADDGDYLWVGSGWGLTRLHRATGDISFYHENIGAGLPSEQISAIAIDLQGNTWIGTEGGGLTKYDGTTWTVYNTDNSGLPNNIINALAVDNDGNVWIGTRNGAVKYDGTEMTVYDTSAGLPNNIINALAVDNDGAVWFGTNWGLGKFDGQEWTKYTTSDSDLPYNKVLSLSCDGSGTMCIGTITGLGRFDGESWVVYKKEDLGMETHNIDVLANDTNGNTWIGNRDGLARFDGENWTVYNTDNSGLPNNNIISIVADTDGSVWAGTSDGLAQFDGTAWKERNTVILAGKDNWSQKAHIQTSSFDFEGHNRNYMVFLPNNYFLPNNDTGTIDFPLVLNLHWYGGDAIEQKNYSGMNAVADTAGFIIAYPNAIQRVWNSGISDNPDWNAPDVNDVGFIDALIDTLFNSYSIDPERIYSCGLSNGGFMSLKLACQLSDRIAAVACVSGPITASTAKNCNANHAMPVLLIHGTEDPVPYDGTTGWYSVEQTISHWTDFNNCTKSEVIALPDIDDSDGCTVEKTTYTDCSGNVSVVLFKIINGVHRWPGGDARYFGTSEGLNKDINASVEIWNFFKNYTLSQATEVSDDSGMSEFTLLQNYPNPFNLTTTIEYSVPCGCRTTLTIYNSLGQLVATLNDGIKSAGRYSAIWDAAGLPSGLYFSRLNAGEIVQTKKILLLK